MPEESEELRLLVERLQEEEWWQLEMQFREECQRLQKMVQIFIEIE